MDRDPGKPKKQPASAGTFAWLTPDRAGLAMKQIRVADLHRGRLGTRPGKATATNAYDRDGTRSEKEFRR
jgi:hypothetical protein